MSTTRLWQSTLHSASFIIAVSVLLRTASPNFRYTGSQRRWKHHQWLTEDVGNPHLTNQVSQVLGIMRASETKAEFKRLFERAFPNKKGHQLARPLPGDGE